MLNRIIYKLTNTSIVTGKVKNKFINDMKLKLHYFSFAQMRHTSAMVAVFVKKKAINVGNLKLYDRALNFAYILLCIKK